MVQGERLLRAFWVGNHGKGFDQRAILRSIHRVLLKRWIISSEASKMGYHFDIAQRRAS